MMSCVQTGVLRVAKACSGVTKAVWPVPSVWMVESADGENTLLPNTQGQPLLSLVVKHGTGLQSEGRAHTINICLVSTTISLIFRMTSSIWIPAYRNDEMK